MLMAELRELRQDDVRNSRITSGALRVSRADTADAEYGAGEVRQGAVRISRVTSGALRVSRADTAVVDYGAGAYEGDYEVTPGPAARTLPTADKRLERDITIGPIPSNYGLITWNGSTLTVS